MNLPLKYSLSAFELPSKLAWTGMRKFAEMFDHHFEDTIRQ